MQFAILMLAALSVTVGAIPASPSSTALPASAANLMPRAHIVLDQINDCHVDIVTKEVQGRTAKVGDLNPQTGKCEVDQTLPKGSTKTTAEIGHSDYFADLTYVGNEPGMLRIFKGPYGTSHGQFMVVGLTPGCWSGVNATGGMQSNC
ncbi:hypothetical protein PVAR5_1892 [Paecilomyces variotii No. 5]|uniref:Uncharacterized protein n=1 Tax=Byssochlamys spectabilis (strain No. 5 / NBRC 109023) TaxID=1356009 RepID=V5FAB5_BYSSN|nr:hypothetical protein PVAR5_1892 [Paecilomyces variotii No. 5]